MSTIYFSNDDNESHQISICKKIQDTKTVIEISSLSGSETIELSKKQLKQFILILETHQD
ncbi:MAG: hypothetical protein COA63_013895 [Methylophaga sp.]|nr:hypothetical protein [Methylophaga sp.]